MKIPTILQRRAWAASLLATGLGLCSTTLHAQTETAPPPADAPPLIPLAETAPPVPEAGATRERAKDELPEVIVTANRRAENAQNVAISITVLDQKQLDNANVTNASDLQRYTPSLTTDQRFGPENSSFAIRGFTQSLRTAASVATYFAEVVAPRGQSTQTSGDGAGPGALFDLQSVQVLKGPQGTLFGRNSTGGAVLLTPQKPTADFEAHAEVSAGNYHLLRGQGVINVPVGEALRLRLAVDHQQRDGYLRNYTGIGSDELGDVDYTAYRLGAVLDLAENLENYLILSYVDSQSHGYTSHLLACNPNPLQAPFALFTAAGCNYQRNLQQSIGRDSLYDVASSVATPITAIKEKRLINTTTWRLGEQLTAKNIFGYAHLWTRNGADVFGTHWPETSLGLSVNPRRVFSLGVSVVAPGVPVTSQATTVEEVQLLGEASSGRLKWQGGVYLEHSDPDGFSGNNAAGFLGCDLATLEQSDPSQYDCFDPLGGVLGAVNEYRVKTWYRNRALYLQSTLEILPQLNLTGGLRYTWDRTHALGEQTRYAYLGTLQQPAQFISSQPHTSSQAPSGLVELDYHLRQEMMFYGKYVRGYRQGSANVAADVGIDTWKPEYVDNYEIGAKTSFGGWLPGRFNIALFDNKLTNMQLQGGYISPQKGPTTAIFNAGKAEIRGVEIETLLRLYEGLNLSLSYSALHTRLLRQDDNRAKVQAAGGLVAGLTYTPIADVGDTLPFAPDQTYVAALNYRLPLSPDIGSVELGGSYSYTGQQRAAATSATPYAVLHDYALLDLNLSWTGILRSSLDLSLYGTNVLDKQYIVFLGGTYNALGIESVTPGMPRMFGARLRYNFGN